MTRDYAAGYRAGLDDAVKVVRRFLSFDSQRAVSWHEVNDAIAAIRALPAPAGPSCPTCGGTKRWFPHGGEHDMDEPCPSCCAEPTPAEALALVDEGKVVHVYTPAEASAPRFTRPHCPKCQHLMHDEAARACLATDREGARFCDCDADHSRASAPPRAEGERCWKCVGTGKRPHPGFAVGPPWTGDACGVCGGTGRAP